METITDMYGVSKRIPEKVEHCLNLWCQHCYYLENDVEKCINPFKREEEFD